MSWQEYVDQNLIASGKVQKAAILGHKGGVWAKSGGYELNPAEQKAAVNAFSNPDATLSSGVRLGGQKFFAIQCNERSLYGKKQVDGCVLVKTKQAVLVAEYIAPIQAAEAIKVVEGLADYLISVGY